MAKLTYQDYHPLSKAEMKDLGLKGRQYRSASTGDIIPISRFQKLAGSQAPSRQTVKERNERLAHVIPTMVQATRAKPPSQTLMNRRAYSEKYGVSLREASQAPDLKYLNREWKKDLQKLKKLEGERRKKDPQSPEEVEVRKRLSETAKAIGRKRQDDYRDFGQTDTIS